MILPLKVNPLRKKNIKPLLNLHNKKTTSLILQSGIYFTILKKCMKNIFILHKKNYGLISQFKKYYQVYFLSSSNSMASLLKKKKKLISGIPMCSFFYFMMRKINYAGAFMLIFMRDLINVKALGWMIATANAVSIKKECNIPLPSSLVISCHRLEVNLHC